MAAPPVLDAEHGPAVRRKRTRIVGLYTHPPENAVVVCADELGPLRAPGLSTAARLVTDGHRIKAPLDYSRGPDKTWVYGSLRVGDGTALTMTASSRNSVNYQAFLERVEAANPGTATIYVITDNLSSHNSKSTREWLDGHPQIQHVFIPVGACRLNLQEAWWRIFRRHAIAGQCFADPDPDPDDIDYTTRTATTQFNTQAKPWVWGRPPPPPRRYRRRFDYTL